MRTVALLGVLLLANSARAEDVEYLGEVSIPGTATDRSGLKGATRDGTPAHRLGGLGSGIAFTGKGDRYLLVADRGPKDGDSDFLCRWHFMDIVVTPGTKKPVRANLFATTLLRDEKDNPLPGSLEAVNRFDPEGVRVGRTGTVFLADEYGPTVAEFDIRGKRLRTLAVPVRFQPSKAGRTPKEEMPPRNVRGRQPNRGMEGLAIVPDGSKLMGIMQSPLIQDGALNARNERVGVNVRMLEMEVKGTATREFVYRLESPSLGISEIVAVDDTTFLVLERDGLAGKDAKVKRIYWTDVTRASDVSAVESLPMDALSPKVIPVTKRLLIDLLDPRFKLAGESFPEKVEGLAFGPDLPDGRRLLLVTADNDFIAEKPLRIFAFGIHPKALSGYQPQQFGGK